jgi:hypothetical protein
MTHVTSVGGNLELLASINARILMPELLTIGGNLGIARSPGNTLAGYVDLQTSKVFPKLKKVGGDLVLDATSPSSCVNGELASLMQVIGHVIIRNSNMIGHLGTTGATPLTLGGLEVRNSNGKPPFFSDLKLSAGAPVVLEDNPNLCSCVLTQLQTSLAAAGWTGTVQLLGTNGSLTCSPCPGCP